MKINKQIFESLKQKLNITSDAHILGIRGCISSDYGKWLSEINIEHKNIDHESMNCTFILFDGDLMLALNGSTSPHMKYISKAKENAGRGANQLETGFYRAYAKGMHHPSDLTAHKALRQTRVAPIRRTTDNTTFELTDKIEVAIVGDNIHAAWCNIGGKTHASAGCQVIAGYPECEKRKGNTSHWKLFHDYIYSLPQETFNYLLVNYSWVDRVVNNKMSDLIIYGSEGEKVKELQKVLNLTLDGLYLRESYAAIMNFQKALNLSVDGIVGEQTLKMLGIKK